MLFETSMKSRSESDGPTPDWLQEVLGVGSLEEGVAFELGGQVFVVQDGIPRSRKLISKAQAGLEVEREVVEEAGITVIARKS